MIKILLFLLLSVAAFGEDLYFTQSGSGSQNGTIGNPWSVANVNTSGNWGAGAGKISAGDTLHVAAGATITSPITILGSGTAGNVITILFDTGAKFSNTTWPNDPTNAVGIIGGSGLSYITVDGGTNGLIEATANGEHLANQNTFAGLGFTSSNHITVQNLSILNLYVRVSGDTGVACDGIVFTTWGGDTVVNNCTITYCFYAVYAGYNSGHTSYTVSNSTLNFCGQTIRLADNSGGQTTSIVRIFGNAIDGNGVWYDAADTVHADGIHLEAVNGAGTSNIDDVKVYLNQFGSNTGAHMTAQCYLEGNITNWQVYNNVFLQSSPSNTNGSIYAKGNAGGMVANNTFSGTGSGNALNIIDATAYTIENNIFSNYQFSIYWEVGNNPTYTSDYNDIYLATTKTTEGAHSITTDPLFVGSGDYSLQSGSPAKGAGVDLSGTFTTGLLQGATWPNPSTGTRAAPWDMGAFKYVAAAGSGGSSLRGVVSLSGNVSIK